MMVPTEDAPEKVRRKHAMLVRVTDAGQGYG